MYIVFGSKKNVYKSVPMKGIEVIEKYNYSPKKTSLIGDSHNDYDAALDNKIYFYGYNNTQLLNLGDKYIFIKCVLVALLNSGGGGA